MIILYQIDIKFKWNRWIDEKNQIRKKSENDTDAIYDRKMNTHRIKVSTIAIDCQNCEKLKRMLIPKFGTYSPYDHA